MWVVKIINRSKQLLILLYDTNHFMNEKSCIEKYLIMRRDRAFNRFCHDCFSVENII